MSRLEILSSSFLDRYYCFIWEISRFHSRADCWTAVGLQKQSPTARGFHSPPYMMAAFCTAKSRKLASLTNARYNIVGDARDGLSPRHAHPKNKNGHRSDRFCWCGRRDLNPYDGITRPSNVRVCQFRHSRRTSNIIQHYFPFVNRYFAKKQNIFPLTAHELLKILLDGKRYLW